MNVITAVFEQCEGKCTFRHFANDSNLAFFSQKHFFIEQKNKVKCENYLSELHNFNFKIKSIKIA